MESSEKNTKVNSLTVVITLLIEIDTGDAFKAL